MAREFIAPGNIFTGAGALDMAEDNTFLDLFLK